jgi:hypothetical protein
MFFMVHDSIERPAVAIDRRKKPSCREAGSCRETLAVLHYACSKVKTVSPLDVV